MIESLSYGPHVEQFGELSLPEGHQARPLVVLIHGGFWRDQYRLDLMHPLVAALNARGFATWNIEYRRVGPTGGGYPTTLEDVAAAIDHIADRNWTAVAVVGHSAGGHLALWNASRSGALIAPDLTISLAGVADVIAANQNGVGVDATFDFFGGDYAEVPDAYLNGQPDRDGFMGRVVLLHGTDDASVPVEQSTALAAFVARVEMLPDCDHFDVIDPKGAAWQIVFDELAELS